MNFIHVNLISNQLFPNVIPTLGQKSVVKKVFLVVAGLDFVSEAANLKYFYEQKGIQDVETIKLPEAYGYHNLRLEAKAMFDAIQKAYPDDGIILNATGGTKPMSFAFMQAFDNREQNSFVIYLETAQNRIEFLNNDEEQKFKPYKSVLNVKDYLFVGGFAVKNLITPQTEKHIQIESRRQCSLDLLAMRECENVISRINSLVQMTRYDDRDRDAFKPTIDLKENYWPELEECLSQLAEYGLLTYDKGIVTFAGRDEARYLSGVWFEEVCYLAAIDAGIEHVATSVNGNASVKDLRVSIKDNPNEFDLICVNNNQALFGEVKTVNWKSRAIKGQQVVLKLEALKSLYGGVMASGAVFSLFEFNESTLKRLQNLRDLTPFVMSDYQALVESFARWKRKTEKHIS